MKIRNYLITGGSGFIGQSLIQELKKQCSVIILDRELCKPGENLEIVRGDFSDEKLLDSLLPKVDQVIHLACATIPQTSFENPVFDAQSNITATVKLLNKCCQYKVKKFIFLSSGGTVYGITNRLPIAESHEANPASLHGVMKLSIEKYIQSFSYLYGMDYLIFRPSNVYGLGYNFGKPQGAVNIFLQKIMEGKPVSVWGDGKVIRDYLWADDLNRAVLSAINTDVKNKIYNLGSGRGVSLNGLISLIEKITAKQAKVIFDAKRGIDVPANVLDASLARKELKWECMIGLPEGLKLLYNHYKNIKLGK